VTAPSGDGSVPVLASATDPPESSGAMRARNAAAASADGSVALFGALPSFVVAPAAMMFTDRTYLLRSVTLATALPRARHP
jgi:hypothetical protein